MEQQVALIGYPCGWGAQRLGCGSGPLSLQEWGLGAKLKQRDIECVWQDFPEVYDDENDRAATVLTYSQHLYDDVKQALAQNKFPVTLGGDHSMAVGTWSAVVDYYAIKRRMGLIWIDAHLDAHTFDTSQSKAIHGMPAATLLGVGDKSMVNLGSDGAKLNPEHLFYIGIRSFEAPEYNLLDGLGATIYTMDQVREQGLVKVMQEVLTKLNYMVDYLGITIDLDAFDPERAPGVGSPEKDGLLRREMYEVMDMLSLQKKVTALEIAEYNPNRDESHKTKKIVLSLIEHFFGSEEGVK